MTEAEWLTTSDGLTMLFYLRGKCSDRKLRLFACACCRRIWDLFPCQENRDLVAAVERYPDGNYDDPELNAAITDSTRREREFARDQNYWIAKNLGRSYYKMSAFQSAQETAVSVAHQEPERGFSKDEFAAQAALLREVFGNPFRPATMDAAWLASNGGVVTSVARWIDETGAFDDLPILADALEEAGCLDVDVLRHCREKGPHVRGCWVVDLILAKDR
jgi:hypothetical protein